MDEDRSTKVQDYRLTYTGFGFLREKADDTRTGREGALEP